MPWTMQQEQSYSKKIWKDDLESMDITQKHSIKPEQRYEIYNKELTVLQSTLFFTSLVPLSIHSKTPTSPTAITNQ